MSIYIYNGASVIDEVTFRKSANGGIRAYLHAAPGIDAQAVAAIKQRLTGAGYEWTPFTLDNKLTLEVRGFEPKGVVERFLSKKEDPLLAMLGQNRFIQGKPTLRQEPGDRIGWGELFRKNTMLLSGMAMAIADIGFTIYGFKEAKLHKQINPKHRRDLSEMLAGFSYLTGSTMLSLYGRNDQSGIQVREAAEMILQKARERGFATDDSAAAALHAPRKENTLAKVDNFFRAHPAEIGNMMYFTAGALIAQSALRNRALVRPRPEMSAEQIRKMRQGGWGDTLLGTSTMASGLLATFGKEKVRDPDEPKKQGSGAVVDWIKSNPLAMASYGYIGSTLCHAYTTFVERNEAKRAAKDTKLTANERFFASEKVKAVPWRVLFIGATLVGEFLLSISSKGHGQGVVSDTSVNDSAIAVAADLIVKQPPAMQEKLIGYMGNFLGQPDVLALGHGEAIKQLRAQVGALRRNPWAQAAHAAVKPALVPASGRPEPSAWQAKLAAKEAAAAPMQLST